MKTNSAAQQYAKALFSLVEPLGKAAETQKQLDVICSAISQDAEVAAMFSNPTVPSAQKSKWLEVFFQSSLVPELKQVFVLLAAKNRWSLMVDLAEAFQHSYDHSLGITRGVVRSARALSDSALAELQAKLSTHLNKKVFLKNIIEASLLGGIVAQVGGWTFDDSLGNHLRIMSENLKA